VDYFIKNIKIALVAIYSETYAMTGESHGISVLAGALRSRLGIASNNLIVLDMYAYEQSSSRYADVIYELKNFAPDIVGFSCPYGSYEQFRKAYKDAAVQTFSPCPLVIFGGALPTYIPLSYLREIDSTAIVIQGEGEEALCDLVRYKIGEIDLTQINNICYIDANSDTIIYNQRKQVDLSHAALPYREHLPKLLERNAQIFVENSRGCSWGRCTFCSRKMYADHLCYLNYRRFPLTRLREDLLLLSSKGVHSVTFADEDFCGSGLNEMQEISDLLESLNLQISFDVSMNVNTIYCEQWSKTDKDRSCHLLQSLKRHGLRKVFLGVESGSVTQIKRYNKKHSPNEAIVAINILRSIGIEIEIGFIMFDPLCTRAEVIENIVYLRDNNLADITSSLGSGLGLRLHMDAPYLKLLDKYEAKNGITLYDRVYSNNDLNFSAHYANKDVFLLHEFVQRANKTIRPLYYPLKSLSRYGEMGSLGKSSVFIKEIVVQLRRTYLSHIENCAMNDNFCEADILPALYKVNNDIVELYLNNRKQLKKISAETNNNVLEDTLNSFDAIVWANNGG